MPATKPPILRLLFGKRTAQKALGHLTLKAGGDRLNSQNLPGTVREKKQIASALLPNLRRGILNSRFILRGHQRADVGQIRQEFRRARLNFLALALKGFVRIDGIAQVFLKAVPDLFLNVVADDQQCCASKSGGNYQKRKKKLRA